CAESAAALTLAYVTLTGTPVSTTHTITGAIVGVGTTRRMSAVKWGVAGRIVWAWILTIPAAGTIAAISFVIVRLLLHLTYRFISICVLSVLCVPCVQRTQKTKKTQTGRS